MAHASPAAAFPSKVSHAGEGGKTLGPEIVITYPLPKRPLGIRRGSQWSVIMMTKDRDLKRRIRARAAKSGESYQAARRHLLGRARALSADDERAVAAYFDGYARHVDRFRAEGGLWQPFGREVPIQAMQAAALLHPSPKIRRECLGVLDHAANDQSVVVFRRALRDPVPRVRLVALHGLSCDRCRVGEVRIDDVVGDLIRMVREDSSAKVRHVTVQLLARLVANDMRVSSLLERVSLEDPDDLVRFVAGAAACGSRQALQTRKGLRRRRAKGQLHS